MTATDTAPARPDALAIETYGIDVIAEADRKGRASQLFWPWFAANVSVLGLSYGSFAFGYGVSFWQALVIGVIGIVVSFALCGVIAIAGTRGSAPTMILSRASFGVRGNRLPALIGWLLTLGWETVLVTLATLASATVADRLGWGGGTTTKIVALVVVAVLVVSSGVWGFDAIMRMQGVVTVITAVLTVIYVALTVDQVDWSRATHAHGSGSAPQLVGTLVLFMTAFGLGWINAAADYSRYLPRRTSPRAIAWWTTFGGALAPLLLLVFGLLLAGSSPKLSNAIGADPIGALATALPHWFLVPFLVVAVLGLVGGAVLDIYSSGLSLLSVGLPAPRWAAALLDGVLMTAGAAYIVFGAQDFVGQFIGFLTTLGVPIAAWGGVMIADVALRRHDYDAEDLYRREGRYGDVRWPAVALIVVATAIGWGLVTNAAADWLTWQGYLLEPLGLGGKSGDWAPASLGVLVSLAIGLLGGLVLAWRGRARG